MSTYNEIDIICEECGEEYRGTIWTALHAGVDPELKELLQGGELNLTRCPQCGKVAFQDHFVLYQEPAAELLAYIYPEFQRDQELELKKMMLNGFREAQATFPEKARILYEPILLFGLESLIEMLQAEEARAEQSQIAQVLCKENRLPITLLRPAQARQLHTVRVIPHVQKESPSRENVLLGVKKLLTLNPALDLYALLQKQIEMDPNWTLP